MPGSIDFDNLAQQALAPPTQDGKVVPFPSGPTQGADYDTLAGQIVDMQRSAATQNLLAAQGSSPDREAKALAVSKQLDIQQPAAEQNLEQAQQSADLQRNVQTLNQSPNLSAFVASNPLAARMAQDDFDKLGLLEKLSTALKSGAGSALLSNQLGRLGNVKQAAFGAETPAIDRRIQNIQAQLAGQPKLAGPLSAVQNFTGFITGLADNAIEGGTQGGLLGTGIGAGLGAAAGGVGAVPGAAAGAVVGSVVGFNVDMARVAAGNAYLKMGQMRGADGQQLSEAGKQFGAIFTGAATYALGTYASKIESKLLGETAESLAQQAIAKAVQTPTFTQAVASFAGSTAKGAAQGAAIMTAMEASGIIGEEIAKVASAGHFDTDPGEIVSRLEEAAINGAVLLGTMHGSMRGLSLYGDLRSARRAQTQAEMFKNVLDGATDSKLRERDLQGFQAFMQHQTDGSPVENLYIPAEKVRELYQGARLDPMALTDRTQDPLFGFVADMPKQLQEAAASGGDVVIPTADFVAHLAGSPIAEHLMPDMRVGADAMSVNEAKQFSEEYQRRIKEATDEAAKGAKADSAQQIADEVRQQAVAAGYSDAVASRYAALYAARYSARAERRGLGEDPYAVYKAEAPAIQPGADARPGGRELKQGSGSITDVQQAWTGAGIDHSMHERDGVISLDKIVVPKEARKKGVGTEAMQRLVDYADRTGQRIELSPSTDFGGTSVARLKAFYKRFGFVENKGKNKDFTTMASMLREPSKKFKQGSLEDLYGEMQPKFDVPKESQATLKTDAEGRPEIKTSRIRLTEGKPVERFEKVLGEGEKMMEFVIRSPEGKALGYTHLLLKDGKVVSLYDIETNAVLRGQGVGAKVIEAITSLEPDRKLDISNIVEDAKPFWEKVGVQVNEGNPSSTLDWHQFAESPAARDRGIPRRSAQEGRGAGRLDAGAGEGDGRPPSVGDATELSPEEAAQLGFKDFQQGERGQIRFTDGKAVISLFEKADPSTLIHESGHAWLEELAADANRPDAPRQLKDDLTAVQAWLGHESGEFTTEQHEQFARAAEAYLMEGKAPSIGLARVFTRFKQWLTKIYRTVDSLDTPINDDIRGVFDRLLATDAEIDAAKQETGLKPSFKDRAAAGMTSAEWGAYTRAIDKANQQAESTMLDKMMARVRRQRSAEYRSERAGVEAEVAKEVDAQPDMQALNLLRNGKMPDGSEQHVRLSRDAIKATYGDAMEKELPAGILSKDGTHPDFVAEMLGFDSGDAMVQALKTLENQQRELRQTEGEKRTIRQYQIDTETERRMADRKGELMDEGAIKDEAVSAVHSEGRAEQLALELRYLRRMGAQALIEQGRKRAATGTEEPKEGAAALKSAQWNEQADKDMAAALRESVTVTKPMLEAIRAQVDGILGRKTTGEVGRFAQYLRDERKAAREVEQAILKKDWATAASAKQRQMLSHILYTQAKKAAAEVDRGEATFKRLTDKKSFPNIAQEYTNQIHDLLGRFGFDAGRGEELQRGKAGTLEEFVRDKSENAGIEIAIDPALYDMQGKPVGELTLDEFRSLHEAIDSMREMGRGEKMITIDGTERDIAEVKHEIVTAIRALGERLKSDFYDPRDAGKMAAAKEKLFSVFRGIDASLTKPEALFDQIDKGDAFGIMNRAVFRRLKDAQGREDRWQDVASKDIKDAVKAAGKDWGKRLDDVVPDDPALVNPETGRAMKLTRKRMLSMALNWGNEGNRAKLADGYKWSPTAIKGFLDRNMTKADWDFVQRVWGMFDAHKQNLDDLQRRVTGVGLDMVHADAFDTPHGRYAGGYYPIVYDAGKSFTAETHAEKATDALFPNGYTRATTPKGSTISRVEGVKRPIQLSLDIAPWKIGQVIHDLAFREAIIDADRLLSADSVKKAMDDVFGPEYRKLLRPWLKHVANSRNIDDAAIGWIDKAISTARTNTVIVGIGFRLSTMFKHGFSALSNSVKEVGPEWMLKGTAEFYRPGRMKENWDFITSRSAEMKYRMNAYDKDVASEYNKLVNDSAYTAFQKQAQHFGHLGVSYLDLGSAAPTWLGAYRKAQSQGLTEADAIYAADKTVRNAHGAQGITDTAQIQRAKGAANLINMFYGFFNHIYNRQRTMFIQGAEGVRNVKAGEYKAATKNFADVLATSFWYIAVPALVETLAHHGGPDENKDEGWGEWAAKAILAEIPAGIPVMRDIAKAAIEGRDYEISPIAKAVNDVIGLKRDISNFVQGNDPSPNVGKHVATSAGYLLGLPLAAPFTAGKFLWDVGSGEADPRSIHDWYEGLTKGKVTQE